MMYIRSLHIAILLGLSTFSSFTVHAQYPGGLDLSFDPGVGVDSRPYTTVVQSDGQILVGGGFSRFNGTSRNGIARLNADGSVDISFDPGTGATDGGLNSSYVKAIAIQADGKVLVGGGFGTFNGVARKNIARLNTDGSLDMSFDPGSGTNQRINAIAVQSDGKIIIGGEFTLYNGATRNRITRLNSDGGYDTTFVGQGANSHVSAVAIQSDGKILIGGVFFTYDGWPRKGVTRLNSDGSLDTTFANVISSSTWFRDIAIQDDGKLILASSGGAVFDGISRPGIARLDSDGSLDTTFLPGAGPNGIVSRAVVQSNGQVVIGGYFTSYDGSPVNRLARLNTDGSLDTGFLQGAGPNGSILEGIALQADDRIIIGGSFNYYNGTPRPGVARLDVDGSLDTTFDPGSGANEEVLATAIQNDGRIMIGGGFTAYHDISRNRIARVDANGVLDLGFDPGSGANGRILAISIQPDGAVVIGGELTSFDGVQRNGVARLSVDGSLDTTFDPGSGANGWVRATALQSDGKILIAGDFTSFNGITRNGIARLNSDGSNDPSFDPGSGTDDGVATIALQSDGRIVVGGAFTMYDGTIRDHIARLEPDGSLDSSFDPGTGASDVVSTVALQSDASILIGGDFTNFDGTLRNRVARLLPDGSLDSSFDPGSGANAVVLTTAIQSNGSIILGGSFDEYDGAPLAQIVRLNTDGSRDVDFVPGVGSGGIIRCVSLQNNGKLIIGGDFGQYYGTPRNHVARLFGGEPTGIYDPEYITFEIFPNPASSNVTVIVPELKKRSELRLLNTMGQVVMRLALIPGQNNVSLEGIASGAYFVQVEGARTERLVVE